MRLLIFAALTASIAAIPCAALAASKAPPEKASPPTAAAERQKAFVTVNGVAISEIEAKIAMEDRRTAGAADSPALQNSVRTQLVARELFAQQARKQGLDKDKSLLARVRMSSEEILARSYQLDFMARQQIADEQVRKEYDTTKQRSGDKEFRLRQLILATEDEAKGVIARVRGGESMQSLAASSRDESSRNRGGDLGWIPQGNLLPQFAEAVAKLGKGQHTPLPLKSPAGWHVLLLEDQRPFVMPPYDGKMQTQLRQALARQALSAHLAELTKAAKIE